jgi:hypothetical protein
MENHKLYAQLLASVAFCFQSSNTFTAQLCVRRGNIQQVSSVGNNGCNASFLAGAAERCSGFTLNAVQCPLPGICRKELESGTAQLLSPVHCLREPTGSANVDANEVPCFHSRAEDDTRAPLYFCSYRSRRWG